MPRLHKNQGVLLRPTVVLPLVGAAHPGAGGVAAVFVDEFAGQDQDLFATSIRMGLEVLAGWAMH